MSKTSSTTFNTTEQTDIKLTDLMTVEPPAPTAPAPDQIQWVSNKGSYYPFSEEISGSDIVEFRVHGTIIDTPFLKGGPTSFLHSVSVDLSDKDRQVN